jgi:small subunit ribosomal protein S9
MTTKIVKKSGKKKSAVARATLYKGTGHITINKRPLGIIQPELARQKIYEPIMVAENWSSSKGSSSLVSGLDIVVNVRGGGFMGQAEATRTAVAKGIVEWANDAGLREAMISFDRKMLVSDHRRKLPKHYGGPGARSKKQKSYR